MPALAGLFLGSISTVVDTSELQRRAFNEAFARHGLDWEWDRDRYLEMLASNGGSDRIARYARSVGADVDADAVHATKSAIFRERLAAAGSDPRPGVAETIRSAREHGLPVALVTSTSPENVTALLDAVADRIGEGEFDVVVDSSQVTDTKPDPTAYTTALNALGLDPARCVAVEDNLGGLQAAQAAGIPCVAFPNENTAAHDFAGAAGRVDRLDLEELRALAGDR